MLESRQIKYSDFLGFDQPLKRFEFILIEIGSFVNDKARSSWFYVRRGRL